MWRGHVIRLVGAPSYDRYRNVGMATNDEIGITPIDRQSGDTVRWPAAVTAADIFRHKTDS